MKRINIFNLILLLVFSLLSSCSDDKTTNPDDNSDYGYPLTEGTWWKYSEYNVDEEGMKVEGTETEVLLTVGSKKNIEGKEASEFINSEGKVEAYMFSDDSGFYSYLGEESEEEIEGLFDFFPSGWIKVLDYKNDTWTIFEKDLDFTIEDLEMSFKGKYSWVGYNRGTQDIEYKGKSYQALKFVNITIQEGVSTSSEGSEQVLEKDSTTYLFVHGIGIMKTDYHSDGTFNGSQELLIDHEVK